MPVVRVDGLRQQFINLPSVYYTPNNQSGKRNGTRTRMRGKRQRSPVSTLLRFAADGGGSFTAPSGARSLQGL